jgi:beta-galactosidase/evolved beta-galactosidase subunit alpha
VINRYDFLTLDHLHADWSITMDGQTVQSGVLVLPEIKSGGQAEMEIPCDHDLDVLHRSADAERWLNVRFSIAADCPWAEQGHEVAWAQFLMKDEVERKVESQLIRQHLHCTEAAGQIILANDDFRMVLDTRSGRIHSLHLNGKALMKAGPRLNFWRAPIDNDMYVLPDWRKAHLDRLTERVDEVSWTRLDEGTIRIAVSSRIAPPVFDWGFRCVTTYTVTGTGQITMDVQGIPEGKPPVMLPKIGLQMELPCELDRVKWYGRGPGENYSDSKEACRVGVYTASVDGLFTPYIYPQENGNRTDVRWISITDASGLGLLAVGNPTLEFSARRYTDKDLEEAKHASELVPRDFVTLNLDYRQNGLGSNSCGPAQMPDHKVTPGAFTFRIGLTPFLLEDTTPEWLARQMLLGLPQR